MADAAEREQVHLAQQVELVLRTDEKRVDGGDGIPGRKHDPAEGEETEPY